MLEYPELSVIARQMRERLPGRTATGGAYLNPNANIFQDANAAERYPLLAGGIVASVELRAPEIFVALDNGYGILFGEGGGKIRFNRSVAEEPEKLNFRFPFADGSSLTYSVKLWSFGVYAVSHAEWAAREKSFQPFEGTLSDFMALLENHMEDGKQPVKVFLSKRVGGVMSAFAGEILLYAGVHPSARIGALGREAHARIYAAMRDVLSRAEAAGGRTTETDLYGKPGAYRAMAERKHIGEPCPICGRALGKVSVGGVIAHCPTCQAR